MSDLIDRNVLKAKMYQEAFESDTDMQRWDSGCWIRYKLFENVVDSMQTVPYAPRWVRCEERLPENKKHYYLVCTDMGYMCSCRWTNNMYGLGESDRWGWSIADVPQFQKVTHWMPIEPPKEDA